MMYAQRALAMFASLVFLSCGESTFSPAQQPPDESLAVAGDVEVRVVTTGCILGENACYMCSLNNDTGISVSANGSTFIHGLSPGIHWIGLRRIPTGCFVVGGRSPRPVMVLAGQTQMVAFLVDCSASEEDPRSEEPSPL